MGDHLAKLAAALDALRRGYGPRGLRRQLATVDPALRRLRNIERLRLANYEYRLRALDTRHDPSRLLGEIAETTRRLDDLDRRVLIALAGKK